MRLTIVVWMALIGTVGWAVPSNKNNPSGVKVEVHGVRIIKPAPVGNDQLRAFHWEAGTAVGLLFTVPEGGLLKIDSKASKVTKFVDDKGTDLTKASAPKNSFGGNKTTFSMMPKVSKDTKQGSTEVVAPGLPATGSTTLKLVGEAALQLATGKKDFEAAAVALNAGSSVNAGPIPLTIKSAKQQQEFGDSVFSVTLQAKQSLDSIADIQFFDAQGKKIESRRNGAFQMGFMKNVTVSWTYDLKRKVDSAKIVITHWMDMRTVIVPFDMTISMGLSAPGAQAEDVVSLKSGKTLKGEVLEYDGEIIRIRMANGQIRKGKVASVKHIKFGAQAGVQPSRPAPTKQAVAKKTKRPTPSSVGSVPKQMERIYKSLKITNARVVGGPFSVGDVVTVAYNLTNTSGAKLRVPVDKSFSAPFNLVGTRQHWVQPPKGGKKAAGGTIIRSKATIAAGESLPFKQRVKTEGYAAGKCKYYIEYKKVKVQGGIVQTEVVEFELTD